MKYRCNQCGFETDDPVELDEHKTSHNDEDEDDEWS